MMKKVALVGGLLALLGAGSAYAAGQFPGYPLSANPLTGFEYIPADTGAVASGASFTGSISGTTLTATSITGNIYVGQNIVGANVAPGTAIVSGSGGTWTVSVSQTVASTAMTSGGGGVNPQTEVIQVQQLRSYVLSAGGSVSTYIKLPSSTIANLPTCDATTLGSLATVTNGTAYGTGTYGSAVSATGAVSRTVMCTNTGGATTYAWAYN
jgi:hypothetical protein